ncbi:tRNA (N6-threonylcarbamoyladenosine(37)-N6)-methyltransferase TrmO [Moraxella pluranimalium]|uniref:tRNA (N6-threonylcarbamoyladenosine(37)-N6)-methyltransferase TrmO n=1 Tax=Moraxella pluranimalium TaxID=470453 RepID=A0A1T0CTP9_9GAMM|nr:tRNA (N6-threonylcarbamoyladenosine(37)-N6)-methyltransferase TrmO [Moraxella pluranimalium]OOS25712.1 tRNA (N6-threonylcarbamoyladenosine(37)-N6)-methyltransferase TrmO [Moraxella pluranimalium]
MTTVQLPIIGHHRSPLVQKFGAPRQPNLVEVASVIEFVPPYDTPSAFVGIEKFSHLWVMWQFHQNKSQDNFRPQVRPPRYGGNDKVGVFATRSMYRPSALGLSVVRLSRVEIIQHRVRLHIIGADMVDGTPIVDIKPYLPFVDSVPDAISGEIDVPMTKMVQMSMQARYEFDRLCKDNKLTIVDKNIIQNLIAQDPRVAYRQAEIEVVSTMRYGVVDVDFWMDKMGVMVITGLRAVAE